MAQAIFETAFDVMYLISVVAAGLIMLGRSKPGSVVRLFGLMAVVLGAGDAFHLVPRMWALWTTGLAANVVALGVGKLITSVTMTVFYVLLYGIWRLRYQVRGRVWLDAAVWSLAGLRVALTLLPQNEWFSANPPLFYGVLRNLPFAALGVLLIVLFAQEARRTADAEFRWMWLAVNFLVTRSFLTLWLRKKLREPKPSALVLSTAFASFPLTASWIWQKLIWLL